MTPTTTTVAALLLCCLGGCTSEGATPGVTVTDSAGVTIVESSAPAWVDEARWTLDSIPFFTLSGSGPEYELTNVADATVLADSRIVVLDRGSHQVRFFASDGSFLLAVGREGEGPGDFSRLTSVSELVGDSVLVFDYWLRRATILDGAGSVARILTLPPDLQVQELHPVGPGSLVAMTWSLESFMELEGAYRGEYTIVEVAADGSVVDTVSTMPGWSGYKVNTEEGGYRDYAPLFVVDGHLAASRRGIVLGPNERMELHRYSTDGRLEEIARIPSLDEPLAAEEIAAERAAMIRPRSSAEFQDLVRSLPAPELRPPYEDLLLDSEGFTWVARYRSPRTQADDPIRWHVFDPEGVWLGSLTTPARFTVFEIGPDYILGARRDDYDVQRIEMLRLTR